VERAIPAPAEATARAAAEALQVSCARITGNLRDMLGVDGCAALLSRSIARVETAHPALAAMWRQDGREIHFDTISAATDSYGYPAVAAAFAALHGALIEVLGRLIGDDMALRIINLDALPGEPREGSR
jgi:hypothetical protein